MPVNSIIVIDDNYFGNTWVEWFVGEYNEKDILEINYPIVGKGSLIYHFVEGGGSNWEKISDDVSGNNNKIAFRKIKK